MTFKRFISTVIKIEFFKSSILLFIMFLGAPNRHLNVGQFLKT